MDLRLLLASASADSRDIMPNSLGMVLDSRSMKESARIEWNGSKGAFTNNLHTQINRCPKAPNALLDGWGEEINSSHGTECGIEPFLT